MLTSASARRTDGSATRHGRRKGVYPLPLELSGSATPLYLFYGPPSRCFAILYIRLYSRQEATAHITTIETEKDKVAYINRQLAVTKLERSTDLIEFTLNIVYTVLSI